MDTLLKTVDLTKKYDNRPVVDNLNIEIKKGEIFGLLGPNGAEGLSNKEIAAKLFISEGTVKNHISGILSKTSLSHRTALAVYYLTGKN